MATNNGIPDATPPDKRPRGGYSAPPPDESPRQDATADPKKEYVASSGYGAGLRDYLRALPVYVDDLTREVDLHVYERMRWDECVAGSLDALVYQALADDIDFRPAVDDEDSQYYDDSKAQADTINRVMADLDRPLIEWAYEMVSDAIGGGNRVSEKVVRQEEGGPYSGLWVWDRLKVKPRRHLSFAMDTFNNLRGILTAIPGTYMGLDGSIPVDPKETSNLLPREKFALLSWNSHNDDPRGRPLLRRVYVPWWEKIQTAGEWLKHLSRFGSPSLVGTTAPNSDFVPPQDEFGNPLAGTVPGPEQALLNGLERLQSGGCLVLPYGATVTALQVAQSGSAFLTKVDQCDRAISRGILLAIRAVMEAQHGSKADSQTAQDVTGLVVRYVKNWAARMITRDLVKPLVVWNKGADAARVICPYASLTPVEHQDWSQKATAVAALKTSGFLKPSQEPALAEEMGLPPATEPVEQPQPQPQQGQQPAQNGAEVNPVQSGDKELSPESATFAEADPFDFGDISLGGLSREEIAEILIDAALDARDDAEFAAWEESKHPRGQPENKGQFGPGGGTGGGKEQRKQAARDKRRADYNAGREERYRHGERRAGLHAQRTRSSVQHNPVHLAVVAPLAAKLEALAGTHTSQEAKLVLSDRGLERSVRSDAQQAIDRQLLRVREDLPEQFGKKAAKAVEGELRQGSKEMARALGSSAREAQQKALHSLARPDQRARKGHKAEVLAETGEVLKDLAHPATLEIAFDAAFDENEDKDNTWVHNLVDVLRDADWPFHGEKEIAQAPSVEAARQVLRDKHGIDVDPGTLTNPYDYWDKVESEVLDPQREEAGLRVWRAVRQAILGDTAQFSDAAEFYDSNQLRDERGRWTAGGGSGASQGLPHVERQAQRESAKETVRSFMAGKGSPSLQETSGLAQALSTLTVAQIHEVKREHGLKASAPDKAGLVAKLAERFRVARESKPAEKKPSEKKPTENKASDLRREEELKRTHELSRSGGARSWDQAKRDWLAAGGTEADFLDTMEHLYGHWTSALGRREAVKSAIGDTYSPYNGTHQLLQDIAGKHDTLAGALAEAERQGLIDTRQRSPQADVSPLQRDRQGEFVRRVLGQVYGEQEAPKAQPKVALPTDEQLANAGFSRFGVTSQHSGSIRKVTLGGQKYFWKGVHGEAAEREALVADLASLAGVNIPRARTAQIPGAPSQTDDGKGLITEWVQGKPVADLLTFGGGEKVLKKGVRPGAGLAPGQIDRQMLFGFLANVEDRHGGNYLVSGDKLYSIDHEYSLEVTPPAGAWDNLSNNEDLLALRQGGRAAPFDPKALQGMAAAAPALASVLRGKGLDAEAVSLEQRGDLLHRLSQGGEPATVEELGRLAGALREG